MASPIAYAILGLPFHAVTTDEAEELIRESIHSRRRCFLSTSNLNFLAAARSDPAFRQSVLESDLSVADGMPLIWLARLLGVPLPERVAGSTLFDRLRRSTGQAPIRIFFFGGAPGVAELASQRLNDQACGMAAVGFHDPGIDDIASMSSPAIIDQINSCNPDFVVVALGAKKGQAWIQHNRSRLDAPVISHLGAVINFVAGTVTRAPVWMQRSGLEWLWRIKEESQLARRYFNDGLWLIRTLIRVVLPLAACRYLERDTTSAMLEINDEKGILQLAGNWRDADLLKLCAAIDAHLQRVNTTFRMLDLSCLRTINPAISARLIQLTTMSSGQNPEVTWPAKSSLAFKQLYAQQFRQSRRLIHR